MTLPWANATITNENGPSGAIFESRVMFPLLSCEAEVGGRGSPSEAPEIDDQNVAIFDKPVSGLPITVSGGYPHRPWLVLGQDSSQPIGNLWLNPDVA